MSVLCRLIGHKWRAYALDMPTFKYHCIRCGKRKERRMPWTPDSNPYRSQA